MQKWPQFFTLACIHILCDISWLPLLSSGGVWSTTPRMWPYELAKRIWWRWQCNVSTSRPREVFFSFSSGSPLWTMSKALASLWKIRFLKEESPSWGHLRKIYSQQSWITETQLLAGAQIRQVKTGRTTLLVYRLRGNNNVWRFRSLSLGWFVRQELWTHINIRWRSSSIIFLPVTLWDEEK